MGYPKQNRFLTQVGDYWWYQRFVPKRFLHVDTRTRIRRTLHTKSIEIARMRRDALAEADLNYWTALAIEAADNGGVTEATLAAQSHRYEAAKQRALAHGFSYKPAGALASADLDKDELIRRLLERVELVDGTMKPADMVPKKAETEAVLGGANKPEIPSLTVSQALDLYINTIAFDEIRKKSEKQLYTWKKVKRTSVKYFIDVIGDVDMADITREMANAYRSWWIERMIPGDEQLRPAKPNTANRHIGNMRKLYEDYFTHVGQEERLNPFRKMFFKDNQESQVPSFDDAFVRKYILAPKVFEGLNDDLRLMVYVLIETGARLSEICNLRPEQINLDHEVPHIAIRPQGRELKTWTSKREIPLVGVALDAMRHAPNGFPHYRDKGELVSANLLKAFRNRNLFPTSEHVIYSFRHSFEDRMLAANIDHDMRYYLMGHKNTRPTYGQQGSMQFRKEQLTKIVHPYREGLVTPATV